MNEFLCLRRRLLLLIQALFIRPDPKGLNFGLPGILSATWFGGQVFDRFSYAVPFTMIVGVNAVVAFLALIVIFRAAHRPAAAGG